MTLVPCKRSKPSLSVLDYMAPFWQDQIRHCRFLKGTVRRYALVRLKQQWNGFCVVHSMKSNNGALGKQDQGRWTPASLRGNGTLMMDYFNRNLTFIKSKSMFPIAHVLMGRTRAIFLWPWKMVSVILTDTSQWINIRLFREGCRKNVHATNPKGNMGYDQYTVTDDCSCRTYFCSFLFNSRKHMFMASRVILSNFFEEQWT